jgi:hypothetical protein
VPVVGLKFTVHALIGFCSYDVDISSYAAHIHVLRNFRLDLQVYTWQQREAMLKNLIAHGFDHFQPFVA